MEIKHTGLISVAGLFLSAQVAADTAIYAPVQIALAPDHLATLTIPSVTVGTDAYAVGMEIVNNDPLTFELTGVYGIVSSDAPSADYDNGTLSVHSVKVGNDIYEASLHWVQNSNPMLLVLDSAALKCADCASNMGIDESMQLLSTALKDGGAIDTKYSCNGQDLSLPLTWTPGPPGTLSYAVIMDDLDAKSVAGRTWVHWNLFNIPADTFTLAEGASSQSNTDQLPEGSLVGKNSWGSNIYRGPCPPVGSRHMYRTTVYALSVEDIAPMFAITRQQFESTYASQILDIANTLDGDYP